jgi:hypothetical protein
VALASFLAGGYHHLTDQRADILPGFPIGLRLGQCLREADHLGTIVFSDIRMHVGHIGRKRLPTLLSSPWFIVIGSGRRLGLCASKLSADGFGYPPNAGIEGLAAVRSVVVGRATPLRFFFLCHADAPSSGPSDESSQEFHDESQKFESSTCGVEMLACGETLPALPAWRALAGPVTFGQGRKPAEPGARTARAFTRWRRSGPMATSRSPCW